MSQLPDPVQTTQAPKDQIHTTTDTNASTADDGALSQPATVTSKSGPEVGEAQNQEEQPPTANQAFELSSKPVSLGSNPSPLRRQPSALLSKYVFQAGNACISPRKDGPGGKDSQPESLNESKSTPSVGYGSSRTPPRRQRTTPLQRLGQGALARSRSLNCVSLTAFGTSKRPMKNPVIEERELHSAHALAAPSQGSEDMIIPDSEDDEDEEVRTQEPPVSFDVRRFSFMGK